MGRLDRLGHVPSRLDAAALGGLTGDPLAGLAFAAPAAAMLEAVLASLAPGEAVPVGNDGPSMRPAARVPGAAALPARPAPPASAGVEASGFARAPAPARSPRRRSQTASPALPRSADAAAIGESVVAPPGPSGADQIDVSTPAVLPVRSPEARAGASTPVGVPAPVARSSPVGSQAAAAAAPMPSLPTEPVARRGESDERGSSDPGSPPGLAGSAPSSPPGANRIVTTRHEVAHPSASVPVTGSELAPGAGLAGLVSWWDAREEQRPADEAGIVAATAPPAAAWSVADTPHEAPRTAEGAFESSPVVRLSLRNALEELLLAEARASGIEVDP
jgi:hypothetical protein